MLTRLQAEDLSVFLLEGVCVCVCTRTADTDRANGVSWILCGEI